MSDKRTLIGSSVIPIRFVFFMWLVFALEFVYGINVSEYGVVPRTLHGVIGIFTAPFIHANPLHLISNTFPLLFLSITLFYNYHRIAKRVFYGSYLLTNTLVWVLARPNPHIGASGLIYALASFIIFFGLFRRDFRSIILSAIVLILYGSIFHGVLPSNPGVSWESHLFGSLVGVMLAALYGKVKNV